MPLRITRGGSSACVQSLLTPTPMPASQPTGAGQEDEEGAPQQRLASPPASLATAAWPSSASRPVGDHSLQLDGHPSRGGGGRKQWVALIPKIRKERGEGEGPPWAQLQTPARSLTWLASPVAFPGAGSREGEKSTERLVGAVQGAS